MTEVDVKKVVTGEVTLSYVQLLEARAMEEGQPKKFSCVLVIPKSDKRTIKAIKKAQAAALEDLKASNNGKLPANWKNTLRDGDEDGDLDRNPEYEGCMFMSVSANENYPPGIVGRDRQPILTAGEIYSGMKARVSMVAFHFNNKSKGVSFGLRNVQKLGDGPRLGGTASDPDEDFDDLDDEDDDDLI